MGRRNRERVARVKNGQEKSIVQKVLSNPPSRKAVSLASRKGVVAELSKGSTSEQIGRLDDLAGTGTLPAGRLKDAIMRKAPGEMDKAIRKFQKQGKDITVDSLCTEVKSEPGFLDMCQEIGITLEWFENLARERMKVNKV